MTVKARLCCGRFHVHLMPSTPNPELGDADGVEMVLVLGSSVQGAHLGDLVALVDADDNVVAGAPLAEAPELRAAMATLVAGMIQLFERRAAGRTSPNPPSGAVH